MKDNNKHIEPQDSFSELIRQKLQGHQMPVDADMWAQLEDKLHKKRRKPILWWFVTGSAAVLALLLSIQPLVDEKTNQLSFEQVEKKHIPNKKLSEPKDKIERNDAKSTTIDYAKVQEEQDLSIKPERQVNTSSLNKKPENNLSEDGQVEANKTDNYIVSRKTDVNTTNVEKKDNNQARKSTIVETSSDSISNSKKNIKKLDELPAVDSKNISEPKPKKKRDLLLAAAFGSGGGSSVASPNDMFFAEIGSRNLVKAATTYTRILTADDFSYKSFSAPLSFGLTVRKEITNHLGVETGLVYTYLSTSFEENGVSHYDASLSLHYLGIPVNLIVPIWKDKKWEVYFSGGGMVEKGLRSVYIQNEYIGSQIITTDARTNIDGLQWSVNATLGGTYNLYRNIGIYFEPKFSYYFDNDQPISARTDQPVVIGLAAGVRFKL